jgi:hypothetical protein
MSITHQPERSSSGALAAKQSTSQNRSLKKLRRRGFFVAGTAAPHALLIGCAHRHFSLALLFFILLTATAFFSFPHEEIDTHYTVYG